MDQPNWAEIKSANAAYPAMIAAWVAAIATTLAAGFAFLAVRWAKRAAAEAGKQAKAALDSVDAARKQIALMQEQMEWSEPQPVVLLDMRYRSGDTSGPFVDVKNVGEDAAFDVTINPISLMNAEGETVSRVNFLQLPVLRKNEELPIVPCEPRPLIQPRPDTLRSRGPVSEFEKFMQVLIEETADDAELKSGNRMKPWEARATVIVEYYNAHSATFQQQFRLMVIDANRIQSQPVGSLVRHRIKTNDSPFARSHR